MELELRFFATVREAIGASTARREFRAGATVQEVLAELESAYPELEGTLLDGEEIAPSITVLRNGTHVVHFDGVETELTDGDRLSITPPVTGGNG